LWPFTDLERVQPLPDALGYIIKNSLSIAKIQFPSFFESSASHSAVSSHSSGVISLAPMKSSVWPKTIFW